MSDIAIQVDKLGKCFEIGELVTFKKAMRKLARPLGLAHKIEPNLFWALKDVSFELKKGEVLGVIGRNGAGKSTLLKLLSRITAPSAGRAVINGRVGSLLEVGTGFHPELTGRENVYLNGAILGMKKREIDAKFDEIVAFAETEKFIDTPVKRYSSGMRVRLAFAVAAHLEPEILICDEVLAVGDAAFQAKCLGKMGDVAKEGRTIIFVSHIMPMIESLCPRSVLLGDGKVVFDGRSNEVIDLYQGKSDEKIDASDLSKVVSREGEGSVRFASFFACVPKTKAAPACGQPCCFEITLHSSTLRAIRNVRLSIVVSNTHNQPLIIFDTPVSFGEISNLDLNKKIRCMIPELPLSGGKYLVRLYLESNKIMLDNIRGIQISVSARDYFGTGKTAVKDWEARTVLTRHSWIV